MLDKLKAFFVAHEPTSQEVFEVIVHAMSLVSVADRAKIKALILAAEATEAELLAAENAVPAQ